MSAPSPVANLPGLRQPFWDRLDSSKSVLLLGCGGGYDLFGAVPLLHELEAAGRQVHIGNVSFCSLPKLRHAIPQPGFQNLYEVRGACATEDVYCPEAWLSRFLEERRGRSEPIWALEKTGVRPLRAALEHLIARLGIDALVLIDGGIDSLLRGDESALGTPDEDLVSIAATRDLAVPVKMLACIGFGAEMRDGICHEQVFDRIAALTRDGGFLGTSALVSGTPAAALYREAVGYTFANQQQQRRSHIHDVVLASVKGEYTAAPGKTDELATRFDRRGPHVWISPLLSLFWYFELGVVARASLLLPHVLDTETIWDVTVRIEALRKTLPLLDRTRIPI